jgi:hypothetical protein
MLSLFMPTVCKKTNLGGPTLNEIDERKEFYLNGMEIAEVLQGPPIWVSTVLNADRRGL